MLPTPAVNDMGRGKTVEDWDAWTATMQAKHGNGNGHGKSLEIEAQRLLPTLQARDHKDSYVDSAGCHRPGDTDSVPRAVRDMGADFGPYTAAIRRWEAVIGRPAPSPTEPGANGRPRLSPRFAEWMMGLPDGWVTGVDIPRSAQLKALGNGVVPQQAALALAMLDGDGAAVVPQDGGATADAEGHQQREPSKPRPLRHEPRAGARTDTAGAAMTPVVMSELADAFEKGFLTVGTIAVITGLIVWAADIWTKWRKDR
jgi:hypothetical protein